MHVVGHPVRAVDPVTVEGRHVAECAGRGLEEHDCRQHPLGQTPPLVLGLEPLQRAVHVDAGLQVVVRDLTLRLGHRRSDGAAHRRQPHVGRGAPGSARRRRRRCGRRRRAQGALDVGRLNRAARTSAVYGCEVDALGGGAGAGQGRHSRLALRGCGRPGDGRRRWGRRGGGFAAGCRRWCGHRCGRVSRRSWRDRQRWRGRRWGRGGYRRRGITRSAVGPDRRHPGAHRHFGTRRDVQRLDHARLEALDVDDALLGLDFRDDVAAADGLAGLDTPLHQRGGLHVGTEARHDEVRHRSSPVPAPTPRWCRAAAGRPLRGGGRRGWALPPRTGGRRADRVRRRPARGCGR